MHTYKFAKISEIIRSNESVSKHINLLVAALNIIEMVFKTTNSNLPPREYKIIWINVIRYVLLHIFAIYGLYLSLFVAKWFTFLWGEYSTFIRNDCDYIQFLAIFLYQAGILGITAGAHRLWSHKAFKAKPPLKVVLMLLQTLAFQVSL